MSLFHKQESPDEWRQKRSQEQLAAGGLPLNAEFRLRRFQEGRKLFTSNLSVAELALAASQGIRPVGQVTGTSVYHIGWQPTPIYGSTELRQLTEAQYQARQLAMMRLQKEAQQLGAHGIIHVGVKTRTPEWGEGMVEVSLQGTAIAFDNVKLPPFPFICALSGQDFWALQKAGYMPVGLVFGACVYYEVASYSTQYASQNSLWGGTAAWNQELTDYTAAFYQTRRSAMLRMDDEAARLTAEGVVGVKISKEIQMREVEIEDAFGNKQQRNDMIVTFSALGTAIKSFHDTPYTIDYALPLSD